MGFRQLVYVVLIAGIGTLPLVSNAATATYAGGVVVETSASANSGGQTATGGQQVETKDVSAGVTTHTIITSTNQGSEARVQITTEKNGRTTAQDIQKKAAKGESLIIHVATSTVRHVVSDSVPTSTTRTLGVSSSHTTSGQSTSISTTTTPDWFIGLVTNVINWFIGLWHPH